MLDGRIANFLQANKVISLKETRFSMDTGSPSIEVPPKWSSRKPFILSEKSGSLCNFEQFPRLRSWRFLDWSTSGRWWSVEHSPKFKICNLLWYEIDSWACSKFLHPQRSNILRFGVQSRFGKQTNDSHPLKLMNFSFMKACKNKESNLGRHSGWKKKPEISI